MRPKKRYLLVHYGGSENVQGLIRARYAEKFGSVDLEKASVAVISSSRNGFLILRCKLEHSRRLLETLSSMDDKFLTLNMSGTLKALRSREGGIRKSFARE